MRPFERPEIAYCLGACATKNVPADAVRLLSMVLRFSGAMASGSTSTLPASAGSTLLVSRLPSALAAEAILFNRRAT